MTTVPVAVTYLTIDAEQAGQRLDNFLLRQLKPLSRAGVYRIIRTGQIRVNKKRCSPDYRVQAEDSIRIPPVHQPVAKPAIASAQHPLVQQLAKRILYEDKQLLVLNKPAGVAVHGGSGVRLGIIEALRVLYPQQKQLALVHRLDRDTSGCLLVAKKPASLRICHALLRENAMQKEYWLLVKGQWPASLKKVDQPLHKNQLQSGERMVRVSGEGKAALTHFTIKHHYRQTTLLLARPVTGRTHQIRVHAAWAGFPLVGDEKYGDKAFNTLMRAYGSARLFLHAAQLSFLYEGQRITVTAPLAEDLQKCLNRLTKKPGS